MNVPPRLRKAALPGWLTLPTAMSRRAAGPTVLTRFSTFPLVLTHLNPPVVLTTADLLTCEARLDRPGGQGGHSQSGCPPTVFKAMRAGVESLLVFSTGTSLALLQISQRACATDASWLPTLERGNDWWSVKR